MGSGTEQWVAARRTLLAVVSLAAAGVGGCGSDRDPEKSEVPARAPMSTPSIAQQHAAKLATVELVKRGGLVAGHVGPPEAFGDADCTAADDGSDRIDCSFGTTYYGNMEPTWFEVRMQPDGSLSKVLGSRDPVAGTKSSAQTAALLASDDFVQHAPSRSRDYACRRAGRVAPNGTRETASAIGQLCTTHLRMRRTNIQRYVEFAADGTVTRDYLVAAQ